MSEYARPPLPHPSAVVLCRFYVRSPAGDGQFRYESVEVGNRAGDGRLPTPHPPLPGDLVFLWDTTEKKGGQFRVIERAWSHASWGSVNWPHSETMPVHGPSLDIIVEAADGLFRDEADEAAGAS